VPEFINTRLAISLAGPVGKGCRVQVLVRDNNVDQALKALKKKMQREGIFREMKLRDIRKPSRRRRARRPRRPPRAQVRAKKLQREGLLPMKPKPAFGADRGRPGAPRPAR